MQDRSAMDEALCAVLWAQLRAAGIVPAAGRVEPEAARARLDGAAHHRRWLDESLRLLAARGYLEGEGGAWTVGARAAARPEAEAWAAWESLLATARGDARLRAIAGLADCALRALPDIVTGRVRATDVLFPQGSTALVEGVYRDNPVADHFNAVIADLVVAFVEARRALDPGARLRIIEIGAGTGGTSAPVLARLQACAGSIEHYCYTDLSQAFLMHARQAYGPANPYLVCQTFNVEQPVAGQRIEPGSYDIAIAANVIHATRNIRTSLRNAKALLRANGMLLLNEINGQSLQTHLTFGLLEGWWRYEDDALRIPGCPALTPENWQAALEHEGYRAVFFPAQNAHHLGQQIIAAESNGVVRKAFERRPRAAEAKAAARAAGVAGGTGPRTPAAGLGGGDPLKALMAFLSGRAATLAKVPDGEIDADRELSAYGFDSIGFMSFAAAINEEYRIDLKPAAFYENINIRMLARYLLDNHKDAVLETLSRASARPEGRAEGDPAGRDGVARRDPAPLLAYEALPGRSSGAQAGLAVLPGREAGAAANAGVARAKDGLVDEVRRLVVLEIAALGKIEPDLIDPQSELSAYGFDSIGFMALAKAIGDRFGLDLAPAVFYENINAAKLSQYLVDTHSESVTKTLRPASARTAAPPKPARAEAAGKPERRFSQMPIAIVGMSAKFPMSDTIDEYWRNILDQRHCIREVPPERWDWRAIYGDPRVEPGKTNVKWGGFVDGIDEFDADFFGLTEQQARVMDPRTRLFLMHAWNAIEDAGYSASALAGSNTATFLAMLSHDGYADLMKSHSEGIDRAEIDLLSAMSPANWLSYFLDLKGPSEPVQTACSSSLVAVHRAALALRSERCDMAVVGAVNALLTPDMHVSLSKYGILSEDGRCKTFSKDADGFVRSEGVGVLVLKTLDKAEADGDHIYGLVLGSAENHNGRTQSLMSPNPKAQKEVLVSAYRSAGIDPETVSYVELHGTGTLLGDSIEVSALKGAFKELGGGRPHDDFRCVIGSVKALVGHLESASGIASIIKVLMQFRHETIVPNPYASEINPYIAGDGARFDPIGTPEDWPQASGPIGDAVPRRAGISAFGAGGVNAHIIVEEYLGQGPRHDHAGSKPEMIVLSAKTEEQLGERVRELALRLGEAEFSAVDFSDLAYTLQTGRQEMRCRLGLLASSVDELRSKLDAYACSGGGAEDVFRSDEAAGRGSDAAPLRNGFDPSGVDTWLERGEHRKVLHAWTGGAAVDWQRLRRGDRPRRVALPTYPFARNRYWIETAASGAEA